jgi:TubC N-terminal docking domain
MTAPSVAAVLLADLAAAGVRLAVEGDRLRFTPRAAATPDLIERLRKHKAEVIAVMTAPPTAPAESAFGPEERRARLMEDVGMWPERLRRAYGARPGAAAEAGQPIDLGSPAESAAREEAEVAAGWHRGWPARKSKPPEGAS